MSGPDSIRRHCLPALSPAGSSKNGPFGAAGMNDDIDAGQSALTQLRAYLAQRELPTNSRLPPERELSEMLGVSRGALRKALATLESHGELWRHVGKGTFTGTKPIEELFSIGALAGQTNPAEVMRARQIIEPDIAREAALSATADDIAEMRRCLAGSRRAETWRQYENWDNRLHRAITVAAHNTVLLALFDTLNAVRRAVVWGRLRRDPTRPPADHHSFRQHEAIVAAIEERDLLAAANRMRLHLQAVEQELLGARQAAE